MKLQTYPELNEQIYWGELPNGLKIAVVPRPGFSRKLAYFVTDFGSIHRRFLVAGQVCQAPAGVAHFLEHKLFDMPGRDITGEFAALGASPNAFTSYDMTAYYFSCTERFEESLTLLLEFVSTPYFTEESVRKEQPIIGQEIEMNVDSADTRVFENLMQAMYRTHPIREPILGTQASISEITPALLQQCHSAYYAPGNMFLCVVGDVDPMQVRQIAQRALQAETAGQGQKLPWAQEEMTCEQALVEDRMEVAMPMFQLGFKSQPLGMGEDAVRREFVGDLAAEALFGESSKLYLELYESGVIDSSFGGGFETVEGMSMLTASGDSWEPETVQEAILQRAQTLLQEGIAQEDFLRMKRSALGRRIRDLDSFDATCFRICAYHFTGFDYFRFPALYRDVEVSEVLAFVEETITRERCCMSVVYPTEQEEHR